MGFVKTLARAVVLWGNENAFDHFTFDLCERQCREKKY
jgi:hypothetical protein